jgi:hypothetical protein
LWEKPDFASAKVPPKHDVRCEIELEEAFRSKARGRSVNPTVRDSIAAEVKQQRASGLVEPSSSPYASTVLLVPKADGSIRFCVDYRALNSVTKKDGYLMPKVDDNLSALKGSMFFTSLDLSSAFHQIPMDEASKDLTSFMTPDGTFRYTRMPFGLVNGPAIFSRFIDTVLAGLKWTVCLVYMDDILVHSKTFEEHIVALRSVFRRIDDYGLRFKAKKCFIGAQEVKFLGHVVCREGIKPDPDKTKAIRELPMPKNKGDMRSALGLFGYYRRYCKSFAKVAHPLNQAVKAETTLPRGESGIAWTDEQRNSFEALRSLLLESPVLAHPDWSKAFAIHTDWCKQGIGAVLTQKVNGKERVISFASRALRACETKYSPYEGECLAVVWAVELWYSLYLYGRKFTLVTDNDALTWLFTKAPNQHRVQRWVISLQDLDFDTKHRKGSQHGDADGLSRCHLPSTNPYGEEDVESLYGAPPPIACPAVAEHEEEKHNDSEVLLKPTLFPPSDEVAWTPVEWARLQAEDDMCSKILSSVRAGGGAASNFKMVDGVLCRVPKVVGDKRPPKGHPRILKRPGSLSSGRFCPRRVVPSALRKFVLEMFHGLPAVGHPGRTRTYAALSAKFWWKGVYRDVRRFIRACRVCAIRKTPRPLHAGTPCTMVVPFPWHTISADILGPLPLTSRGNMWMLTMSDGFTRWPIAVPLPDTKASTVCDAIYTYLLAVFGCPLRILTDRGKQLISKAVHYLCKRWGIRSIATSGYQAQANPVERLHSFLNSAMTALHGHFGMDWDRYIDAALFVYRSSVHEVTGYTPYYLLFGREPTKPSDLIFTDPEPEYASELEYATFVGSALASAYKFVHERQVAAAERNIMYRMEHARQVDFFIGQRVFYWQPGASSNPQTSDAGKDMQDDDYDQSLSDQRLPNKWRHKWTGPHRIVSRVVDCTSGNLYLVRHRATGKVFKANVNRLAPFHPWSDTVESTSPIPSGVMGCPHKIGGRAEVGDMIAFPLDSQDGGVPFGIGRLLSRSPAGELDFQWFSNAKDSMLSPIHPGWLDTSDNKYVWSASKPTRRSNFYEPLRTSYFIDRAMTDVDVVVHGFGLDKRSRIPPPVLSVLSDSAGVDWCLP